MKLKFKDLYSEYKGNHDSCDAWGSAMSAFFDVAEELYIRGTAEIPEAWGYRPPQIASLTRNRDSFFASEVCIDASDDALIRFGNMMNRYTALLKRHGADY